jgi:hypothetical protein
MGYTNQPVNDLKEIFAQLGWYFRNPTTGVISGGGDRWVIVLAAIAIVLAFAVRDRLGMVLATLAILSFFAYVLVPQSALWNERFVPFWFITIHLIAGWLIGYLAMRWVRRKKKAEFEVQYLEGDRIDYEPLEEPEQAHELDVQFGQFELYNQLPFQETPEQSAEREKVRSARRTIQATAFVALLGLFSTVPGLIAPVAKDLHLDTTGNQVTNWAQTNYSGYQAQSGWPEYHDIMTTMEGVAKRYGCGRAMWEYNADQQRFGTPEALMLLPYWTNNCVDSMEGLFFESSATTPYHWLDQAELSLSPSDPQVGLDYGTLDVFEGVEHLQMLGVKYYIAYSANAVAEANSDPELQLVATTKHWPAPGDTWCIYLIKDSAIVQPLTFLPNVVSGISSRVAWLKANEAWWLKQGDWSILAAESGPAGWPHVEAMSLLTRSPRLASVAVTDVKSGTQSISFHVSRVGIPVLVKISYFPRWHATGATGPYRVSPNLMVVVPTQKDVSLVYGSTPALEVGNIISDAAVVAALVTLWFAVKRRRKTAK